MSNRVQITAHAGFEETVANSLEAISAAVEIGVDVVEMDVRQDAKGTLYLSHDAQEVYESAPLLYEGLALAHSLSMPVNLDIKEASILLPVLHAAQSCGFEKENLTISGSVSLQILADNPLISRRASIILNIEQILRYYCLPLANKKTTIPFPEFFHRPWKTIRALVGELSVNWKEVGEIVEAFGLSSINSPAWITDQPYLEQMAEMGIGVSVWTVDNYSEQRYYLLSGFEALVNLTTNKPLSALSIRDLE